MMFFWKQFFLMIALFIFIYDMVVSALMSVLLVLVQTIPSLLPFLEYADSVMAIIGALIFVYLTVRLLLKKSNDVLLKIAQTFPKTTRYFQAFGLWQSVSRVIGFIGGMVVGFQSKAGMEAVTQSEWFYVALWISAITALVAFGWATYVNFFKKR